MRTVNQTRKFSRNRPLAVEWLDRVWHPRIELRRVLDRVGPLRAPLRKSSSRNRILNPAFFMKINLLSSRRRRAGFTLVELLTVIAIIGILAATLMPVLTHVQTAAKKAKAKLEEQQLLTAIQLYDSTYGRFPVSPAAQAAAQSANSDFTYGGTFGGATVFTAGYTVSNAEVIAILMNITNYPGTTTATVNTNSQKNPQQTVFLNTATMSGYTPGAAGTPLPGVGTDLVYRDPWGNPYVITMDLNYDEMCKDKFYSLSSVSGPNGNSNPGLNGLVNPTSTPDNFQERGKVMVWSAGPDGRIDPTIAADTGVNKDNVLSWK
jgi:prepilin-type N-terminal cleavage/methylation domain-containing protein